MTGEVTTMMFWNMTQAAGLKVMEGQERAGKRVFPLYQQHCVVSQTALCVYSLQHSFHECLITENNVKRSKRRASFPFISFQLVSQVIANTWPPTLQDSRPATAALPAVTVNNVHTEYTPIHTGVSSSTHRSSPLKPTPKLRECKQDHSQQRAETLCLKSRIIRVKWKGGESNRSQEIKYAWIQRPLINQRRNERTKEEMIKVEQECFLHWRKKRQGRILCRGGCCERDYFPNRGGMEFNFSLSHKSPGENSTLTPSQCQSFHAMSGYTHLSDRTWFFTYFPQTKLQFPLFFLQLTISS